MLIREAVYQDLEHLLCLYTTHLNENSMPLIDTKIEKLWLEMIESPNHHVIVGTEDHAILSSCVLVIIPNLTHNQQPYALIENVITHPVYRNRGYASEILEYAKTVATETNCYKIMLMTGSKEAGTLHFYQKAGYNMNDKTAFIQWLK